MLTVRESARYKVPLNPYLNFTSRRWYRVDHARSYYGLTAVTACRKSVQRGPLTTLLCYHWNTSDNEFGNNLELELARRRVPILACPRIPALGCV
jgi:hypothetical protein